MGKNKDYTGVIARINSPEKRGDPFTLNLLYFTGEGFPKKQHSLIVNYSQHYGYNFFKDLDTAQKEGRKILVKGDFETPLEHTGKQIRHLEGFVEAEEILVHHE